MRPGSAARALSTLDGGHQPALVDGVGLIVGIDRLMAEARALTNFAGNAVATVLVGRWRASSTWTAVAGRREAVSR